MRHQQEYGKVVPTSNYIVARAAGVLCFVDGRAFPMVYRDGLTDRREHRNWPTANTS